MTPLERSGILSAIAKSACAGPVAVSHAGCAGDMQGNTVIHGGPDKALLHYAEHHYDAWRAEFPDSADRFVAGGFGENLVSLGPDETTLCIGDVVAVGTAVLQVAQPRQPCFKLNHRFAQPTMSRRTQQTRRTGWYYRMLTEGTIAPGDAMRVTDRPHPGWALWRIQHHLYTPTLDQDATAELAGLDALAIAMRRVFGKRLETRTVEEWEPRLHGPVSASTVAA